MPYSLRIVLESVLRNCDGKRVTEEHVRELAAWQPNGERTEEIPFVLARILLQDMAGFPSLNDFAAMRATAKKLGGDPTRIEPLVPVDLVVDHSIEVDVSGRPDAVERNMELEFQRNGERYAFLKWSKQAFEGIRIVPPGNGIVHQVNLEYLARGVWERDGIYYPDTLVGTDSHTTMVNGIGVVGWGVGGIEAEAGMLGQPIYFLTPDVVGVHMSGKLREGVTATDVVLTVTELLRKNKVVGKFVEYFGEGAASLTATDRAVVANMSPDYGATIGFFGVDERTIEYLHTSGRPADLVEAVEAYFKAQGMFGIPRKGEIDYSQVIELDLSTVVPSVSGPKRPQDRIDLPKIKQRFETLFSKSVADGGYGKGAHEFDRRVGTQLPGTDVGHGDVLIAAITSCTNTSNPNALLAAGLLAKKAVEKGLKVGPRVKTSLAPGSKVVTSYLKDAGLMPYLEQLGYHVVAYGCTTCMGNAGPLDEAIEDAVVKNDVIACAVLSGNRNFEARVHQSLKANFLMSPPLVVAFALAGTVRIDVERDPDRHGLGREACFPQRHLAEQRRDRAGPAVRERCREIPARIQRSCGSEAVVGRHPREQGRDLRLRSRVHLHPRAAVLRRVRSEGRHRDRREGRACARDLRRWAHDGPHQPRGADQARLARRSLVAGTQGARDEHVRRAALQP